MEGVHVGVPLLTGRRAFPPRGLGVEHGLPEGRVGFPHIQCECEWHLAVRDFMNYLLQVVLSFENRKNHYFSKVVNWSEAPPIFWNVCWGPRDGQTVCRANRYFRVCRDCVLCLIFLFMRLT